MRRDEELILRRVLRTGTPRKRKRGQCGEGRSAVTPISVLQQTLKKAL